MEQKLTQNELAIIDRAFRRGTDEDIRIINDLLSNQNRILVL